MKKKTITIGMLLLTMNSFSQTDTLVQSISGKEKFEFNYHTNEIKKITSPKNYQDYKFRLKKNKFLLLDLFDGERQNTLYLMYRSITFYYRDGYVEKLYFNSNENTLWIDGILVKKVIVHKPELK